MSARAAWRLDSLGFGLVYRYTAGKADWSANGLPLEGTRASQPRIGQLARRDVPTCGLRERVGDVRERVRVAGWDLCLVVNAQRIVLGRLRRSALEDEASTLAEAAMEAGPTTYRPDRPAAETAKYLVERKVPYITVTTGDGELVGIFFGEDGKGG